MVLFRTKAWLQLKIRIYFEIRFLNLISKRIKISQKTIPNWPWQKFAEKFSTNRESLVLFKNNLIEFFVLRKKLPSARKVKKNKYLSLLEEETELLRVGTRTFNIVFFSSPNGNGRTAMQSHYFLLFSISGQVTAISTPLLPLARVCVWCMPSSVSR